MLEWLAKRFNICYCFTIQFIGNCNNNINFYLIRTPSSISYIAETIRNENKNIKIKSLSPQSPHAIYIQALEIKTHSKSPFYHWSTLAILNLINKQVSSFQLTLHSKGVILLDLYLIITPSTCVYFLLYVPASHNKTVCFLSFIYNVFTCLMMYMQVAGEIHSRAWIPQLMKNRGFCFVCFPRICMKVRLLSSKRFY